MRGLKESKPEQKSKRPPLLPRPGTLAFFVILVVVLAFTAGQIRNELGLKLLGVIFSCILVWCFLAVFILGLVHRKKALSLQAYISPGLLNIGEAAEIRFNKKNGNANFFFLPGVFARYEMKLETRDGRKLSCVFSPASGYGSFSANERGAYYGKGGGFFISDAPGFFRLSFSPVEESAARLLVLPSPAGEELNLPVHSGGDGRRAEHRYNRTDELSDHRPYVPGDDPRRINWKLYGHGTTGELFVREGEFEPPPHGKLLILIDTQADAELFTLEAGRRGVDLLCGIALEAALDFSSRGIEVSTGYTGGSISGANGGSEYSAAEAAETEHSRSIETSFVSALAYPACLSLSSLDDLPRAVFRAENKAEKPGILIFALPRVSSVSAALDRFLRDREAREKIDLFFVYEASFGEDKNNTAAESQKSAAETCVNLYRKKPGLNVHSLSV